MVFQLRKYRHHVADDLICILCGDVDVVTYHDDQHAFLCRKLTQYFCHFQLMPDIHVLSLDKEPFSVLTRDGLMRIPLSFALIARLPRDKTSPYTEVMRPELYTDDDLRAISERLNSLDFNYIKVLKALSDQNRLSIVSALMGGRMNVNLPFFAVHSEHE